MIVKRLQDKLKAAAHMHLPVLAWPGVVVAVMTGRMGKRTG